MLQVGLIGAGDMGSYLGQICDEIPGATLAAVAGHNSNKVENYARKYGAIFYLDYQTMLKHSRMDAVIVATPSDTHHKIVLDCIHAGLHVFCEKPLALSVPDCDEMISAAANAQVKLMVGHVLRELPVFAKVREILASRALGKPLVTSFIRTEKVSLVGWYLEKARYRSAFHEMAIHELDILRVLMGEVEEIEVLAVPRTARDLDYDTPTLIRLRFKNGTIGSITYHWNSPLTTGYGTLLCENGTIRCGWRDRNWIEYSVSTGENIKLDVPTTEMNNGYRRELANFFNWILMNVPPVTSAEEGRAAVVLAESALLARETGKPVKVPK
jgi:predicted dehydrogenase